MESIPLAFSIHNFISSVGADAGFAAIIGLAVLVLLYFAHARETANLREEAALLTQRLIQAEARVAQLSRGQPATAPAAAAVAARPVAVGSPAPGASPFAPAGVGAPALAAATRVVPLARVAAEPAAAPQAPQSEPAESQVPATATPAAIPQPAEAAIPQPVEHVAFERERAASPVAAPAPATVAGANGAGHEPAVASSPVAAQEPLPPLRQPSRPGGPPGGAQLPPLRPPAPRRSRLGRGLAILIGAVGVAAVIAVLLIATSGGSSNPKTTSAAPTTNVPSPHKPKRAAAPFLPSSVTVAVLNGTNINQLAHTIGAKLAAVGYKEGMLQTAANQSESTTIVSYFPGANDRIDAVHVAAALKLNPSSVQPIDTTTQQVACPSTTPCTANVVVTVGADLSNS